MKSEKRLGTIFSPRWLTSRANEIQPDIFNVDNFLVVNANWKEFLEFRLSESNDVRVKWKCW